jgi:hypothetical protein
VIIPDRDDKYWSEIMNTTNKPAKPSRKARVRELYFDKGAEEAFTFGRRLKLKESTLHSWFGTWRREDAKAKVAKVRARTEKKRATKQKRQQEGKAELAAQAATTEPAPAPAKVQP